jgi:hypothetical protein
MHGKEKLKRKQGIQNCPPNDGFFFEIRCLVAAKTTIYFLNKMFNGGKKK